MKITKYRRRETEPLDDLQAILEGRVFHVTKLASLPQILADREIRPNQDRSLPTAVGHLANGFFRNLGCVSLFDYRVNLTEEIEGFRNRCSPFQAACPESGGIAILLLKPAAYSALVPWTRWRDENALSEMVVPYVEAGYPGPLSIDLILRIVVLELAEDPESPMASFRRARARRNAARDLGSADR